MSYILDALKKADAERERESLQGIHAQPAHDWSVQALRPAPARLTALSFVLGLAVVVVPVFIAWRISGSQPSLPVAVGISPTATPMLLPDPLPAPALSEAAVTTARVVGVQVAPPRPIPSRIEPVMAPRKPTSAAVVAVVAPKPVQDRTVAAASAAIDDKLVTSVEMPDEVRRELPSLTISGAIHSENVANRFLIINGQIFHETEMPAPGVVLLNIKLKSAVLSFKGYRYTVTY